jgi:hypothetical protein
MAVTQLPEDNFGAIPPSRNQASASSQPQPLPMGMPMSFPAQEAQPISQPSQYSLPHFANAPSMQNGPGIGLNMNSLSTPATHYPLGCSPSCSACVNIRNGNGPGQPIAANQAALQSQHNLNVNFPPPPMIPQMDPKPTNFASRPGGSAISVNPNLLPAPLPLGFNPLMNSGHHQHPIMGPKLNQPSSNGPTVPGFGPSMNPQISFVDFRDMSIPGTSQMSIAGSFPQNTGLRPVTAPQPMPMPNLVNDARGSNSFLPLSTPPSFQPNMTALPGIGNLDIWDPVSKQYLRGPVPQYSGKLPMNQVPYLDPRASNQLPNPLGSNNMPPMNRPQTAIPPIAAPAPVMVPPPYTSVKSDELDLARQFGFININSEGIEPPKTPVTSKDLRETQKDLTPLALAISPSAKPFDNATQIRDFLVQFYGLPYPWEWYLCLKTSSCTHPIPNII